MKRIFYLLIVMTLFVFAPQCFAQEGGDGQDVDFQRYDSSYFEKNNSGLDGEKSYLVIDDKEEFDKVFGPAPRAGKNTFLPQDTFETKIIVATIKRGSMRRYSDVKVEEDNGVLTVSYTATDDKPGSATYRVPLILAVDKGEYSEVVFMENGEKVETVKLR